MMHHCHAVDCDANVPPRLLFCLIHWRKLSRELQQAINITYRKGQEIDKKPSGTYLFYQRRAVNFVAAKEGRPGLEEFKSIEQADRAAALFAVLSAPDTQAPASPSTEPRSRSAGRPGPGNAAAVQVSLFPIARSQEPQR